MLLKSFFEYFPELAKTELRNICCQNHPKLPNGIYLFNEMYCPDIHCDCRKVTIVVMTPNNDIFATIAYGWASPKYYYKWGLDRKGVKWLTQGNLDPLGSQSPYANEFLNIFLSMLDKDRFYTKRLKEHYDLYKKALSSNLFMTTTIF